MPSAAAEPPEPRARPVPGRATFTFEHRAADDPALLETLRAWDEQARRLLAGHALAPATRTRLEDEHRVAGELARVLAGEEEGEGDAAERSVTVALHEGRLQAIVTWIPCRRSLFVELLATAPWNLLGPGDPPDPRSVRGSGTALLALVSRLSRETGRRGRVALQAENPRARAVYDRLGYAEMRPSDAPLANVPAKRERWSESVVRLARGEPGEDERRMPWMLFDPDRAAQAAAQRSPARRARPSASSFRSAARHERAAMRWTAAGTSA